MSSIKPVMQAAIDGFLIASKAALTADQERREADAATGHVMQPAPQAWPFPRRDLDALPVKTYPLSAVVDEPAPEVPSTPPTLTLGKIGARLGFNLSADFLRSLGFEPTKERSALLFHESDWPKICAALIAHIETASMPQAAA